MRNDIEFFKQRLKHVTQMINDPMQMEWKIAEYRNLERYYIGEINRIEKEKDSKKKSNEVRLYQQGIKN